MINNLNLLETAKLQYADALELKKENDKKIKQVPSIPPKSELFHTHFAFSLSVLQICRPLSLKGQIQKNRERKT